MDPLFRRIGITAGHLVTAATPSLLSHPVTGLFPDGLLVGQVAIVTGSGQGIGAQCAKMFAKEGAKVVVTDIDTTKSDSVAASIVNEGGDAVSYPGDVTQQEFADGIVAFTLEKFGKINIIVNNAGYTWDAILHKMTDKQWNAMLEVHNTAPFRLIRAAAPHLRDSAKKEKDKGLPIQSRCIINISSISGTQGNVGQINYATAKAGIIGLTKTVAKEWYSYP
eukprot:TRINITY_DN385_c0_g1_i6.p1 TRINITY_DN385_c0_g1~~TRINITY_DN385_c0_g1_i6.p1  ORF type:complete len:222 (-),score=40.14 TRINITY_DN385_c0_g1_i6:679-1344(-)